MKYWPEISFRFTDCDSSLKAERKVNLFPEQTECGGAENFARCTRVLRKLDSCPGEKSLTNMSTMQNTPTVSRHCNTREPSWAEEFADLTEFCQPSSLPVKMEDSVDESSASSVASNTVNAHHGFDYTIEVNDFDGNIDDTLWRMPSPAMAMQEELGDSLSDWLSVTKEPNNNNHNINHNHHHHNHHHHQSSGHVHVNNIDNLTTRAEISYNISDALLSSDLMSVPTSSQPYLVKKPTNYVANEVITAPSHQLCSDSMYYPNESQFGGSRNHSISTSTRNLILSKPPTSTRLSPAINTMYIDPRQAEQTILTPSAYAIPSHNQFLNMKNITPLAIVSAVSNVDVQASHAVQASSVTQSSPIPSGTEAISRGVTVHRGTKPKLNTANQSVALPGSEMLPPLVSKNSDFDLVSYVFDEHNKQPAPLDVPSLSQPNTSAASVPAIQTECGASQIEHTGDSGPRTPSITIKTEPEDEATRDGRRRLYGKHGRDSKDEEDSHRAKRMRRYSNCSSEDLTQLESEKYRELRNKNNEASRRSRANRKSREVMQREYAVALEGENKRLRMKAEEMEKLVKRLRNCLMQLVLKRTEVDA